MITCHCRQLTVSLSKSNLSTATESLKEKLAYVARKYKYNVLALGTTLDKLANDFITSLMTKGQLSVTPANCFRYVRNSINERFKWIERDLTFIFPIVLAICESSGHLSTNEKERWNCFPARKICQVDPPGSWTISRTTATVYFKPKKPLILPYTRILKMDLNHCWH